jgi:hypothetical protein
LRASMKKRQHREKRNTAFNPNAPLVMKSVIPLTCKWHVRE